MKKNEQMENLIQDITESFILAMKGEGLDGLVIANILATVKDAVLNNVHFPDEQFVVAVGTLFTGFEFHGPFDSADAAEDYAHDKFEDTVYWTIRLSDA